MWEPDVSFPVNLNKARFMSIYWLNSSLDKHTVSSYPKEAIKDAPGKLLIYWILLHLSYFCQQRGVFCSSVVCKADLEPIFISE